MQNNISFMFYYVNLTGVGYFNWPGPEIASFYFEFGALVTFLTTL